MKRLKTIKNLMKTHKKKKQTKKNVFKVLTKNQLFVEQMLIIKNCNTSSLKILREILKNVKRKEIDQIIKLIFLIIKQQVLHLNRNMNTKLLLKTIDTIMITNHSFEIRKIKVIKKIFDVKKYVIDHLRLRQAVKKVFDFDKKNNAKNTNAVEKTNDHEENEKDKRMTKKMK